MQGGLGPHCATRTTSGCPHCAKCRPQSVFSSPCSSTSLQTTTDALLTISCTYTGLQSSSTQVILQLITITYNYLQLNTVNTVKLSTSAVSSFVRLVVVVRRTMHSTTAIQYSGVPKCCVVVVRLRLCS